VSRPTIGPIAKRSHCDRKTARRLISPKEALMNRPLLTLAFALIMLLGSTGCIYSEDRDVFNSTYMMPKTAVLVDVSTGETLWQYDIPPEHILVVERDVDKGTLESIRNERGHPTRMEWWLYAGDASRSLIRQGHYRSSPLETGRITLPGHPVRMEFTVGDPVNPGTVVTPRSVEEIQRDLPEPDAPLEVEGDVEGEGDEEMSE